MLERTQTWLFDAILEPRTTDKEGIDRYLISSTTLSNSMGLSIYQHAYRSRLIECLEQEFVAFKHLIGNDLFERFAGEYIDAYPSTSHTLSDLGAHFPKFLHDTRPERASNEADWSDLLIDLATLERIYAEVFDALVGQTRQELLCQYPVHEYLSDVRRGEDPDMPSARSVRLIIDRPDLTVTIVEASALS